LFEDPGVSLVEDFDDERKIVPAKARGALPVVAVLVEALDGNVVTDTGRRVVSPNSGFDLSESDFVDGFVGSHFVSPFL